MSGGFWREPGKMATTDWSSWLSGFSGRPGSMWIEERYRFNTDRNKTSTDRLLVTTKPVAPFCRNMLVAEEYQSLSGVKSVRFVF